MNGLEVNKYYKLNKEKEVEDTIFFKINNIRLLCPVEDTVEEINGKINFAINKPKENLLTDDKYRVDGVISNSLGRLEYYYSNYKCHDELMHKIRYLNISDISELSEDEISTFENNLKKGY